MKRFALGVLCGGAIPLLIYALQPATQQELRTLADIQLEQKGFVDDDVLKAIKSNVTNDIQPQLNGIPMVDTFIIAGSVDAKGVGHKLKIDEEGRVICAPQQ